MSVQVLSSVYKPGRHFGPFDPRWEWLRSRAVGVWMFWERNAYVTYNIGEPWRKHHYAALAEPITWGESRWGPGLLCNGTTNYVNTRATSFRGVSLFAGPGQQWTVVARARVTNNTASQIIGKGGATGATRTFSLGHNRPGNALATPALRIRGGTATSTGWGLDDGQFHTYWVTWDGTTARAYYDWAQGESVIAVGTAAEETAELILIGALTAAAPVSFINGAIDFAAILNIPLKTTMIRNWQRDLYAPWRPYFQPWGRPPAAQIAVPEIDIAAGGWTTFAGSGSGLALQVDEEPASDTDGIQSPVDPSDSEVELQFGPLDTPIAGGGTLRIRHRRE